MSVPHPVARRCPKRRIYPILVSFRKSGQAVLCFFSSEGGAWEFWNPRLPVGQEHPLIPGELITRDDFQRGSSDNEDDLLALCDRAFCEHGISGFVIDPTERFADPYSAYIPLGISQVKEHIQRKAEEGDSSW